MVKALFSGRAGGTFLFVCEGTDHIMESAVQMAQDGGGNKGPIRNSQIAMQNKKICKLQYV